MKKKALRKLTLYLGEFKAKGKLDLNKKDWDFDTQELIDYLHYEWNVFCLQNGLYHLSRLFFIETRVARDVMLKTREEKHSRDYWSKKLKQQQHDIVKNQQQKN